MRIASLIGGPAPCIDESATFSRASRCNEAAERRHTSGVFTMDKDRIAGAAHQAKGAVKETVGKVTGDKKTQAEGAAEKAAGKVQNAVGGAKDTVRDAADRS